MLPEQQQRIMGYFIEEAKDHLNTIEQGLLSLQATIEDSEKANEIFRAAHSVKGGAAMLGIESIQTIAHRMEDYFKILKESSVQVDSTLETMFLRISDGLKDLLEQLEGPFGLTPEKAQEIMADVDPVFSQLEKHLDTLVAASGGAKHGTLTPTSATADALQVTFKQNIPTLLRQLLSTFKQADTADSRRNLQDICTELSSIGRQFELSAWCDLIETARLAAEESSNEYRVLAPILIKEIKKSQELVLSDRASEVGVSEAMQALLPEDILATANTSEDDADATEELNEITFGVPEFESDTVLSSEASTDESDLFADGLFDTEIDTNTEDLDALFGPSTDHTDSVGLLGPESEISNELDSAEASHAGRSIQGNLAEEDIEALSPSTGSTEAESSLQTESKAALGEQPTSRLNIDLDFNEIPSELSALNRNTDVEERADESLDALLATVNVTGPDVGTEELNSLADLFDGDLEELDNTLGGHPFVSEEMRLHPERIDLEEEDDLTDFLTDDSLTNTDSNENDSAEADEIEDDLFGGTLTEGGFADIAEFNLDEAADLDEATSGSINEENSLDTDLAALAEDPWAEQQENDNEDSGLEDLFGAGDNSLSSNEKPTAPAPTEEKENTLDAETDFSSDDLEENIFGEVESEEGEVNFDESVFDENDVKDEVDFDELLFNESDVEGKSLEEKPLKEKPLKENTFQEIASTDLTKPSGNLSSGLFSAEPVSPSEQEIEFPTLTGVKLEEAEKDIDSFFFDLPIDESDDFLDNDASEKSPTVASEESQLSEDPWGELNTATTLPQENSDNTENDSSFSVNEIDLDGLNLDSVDLNEPKLTEPESANGEEIGGSIIDLESIDFDLPTVSSELEDESTTHSNLTDSLFDIESPSSFESEERDENNAMAAPLHNANGEEKATNSVSEEDRRREAAAQENNAIDSLWDDLSEPTESNVVETGQEYPIDNGDTVDLETPDDTTDIEPDIDTVFSVGYYTEDIAEIGSTISDGIEGPSSDDAVFDDLLTGASTAETASQEVVERRDESSSEDDFLEIEDLFSENIAPAKEQTEATHAKEENNLSESLTDDFLSDESGDDESANDELADDELTDDELTDDWLSTESELEELPLDEALAAISEDEFPTIEGLPGDLADSTISTLNTDADENENSSDEFLLDFDATESEGAEESLTQAEQEPENTVETAPQSDDEQANDEAFDFDDLESLLDDDGDDGPINTEITNDHAPVSVSTGQAESTLEEDEDFDDLERLLEDGDSDSVSSPKITRRAAPRAPRRSSPAREQNMRVPVKHLDNLSNLVGELVVNRNTLERDQERLRQFLDNLLFQVQQLNDVGQRMRDLYERSLLESSLVSNRKAYAAGNSQKTTEPENHATGATFDALEMDRFTGFHTLSQEMIELIVRVRESSSDIGYTVESSDQVTRQFRQVTTQLQEGLNTARMVAFSQAADRLPRAVRDISLKCGKEARLIVDGKDTLIDKMIVEHLYDPLTHLVNNAITHGIETPEERIAAGKRPEGSITVQAFYQGNQTVIYVADDGGGINPDFVQRKAVEKKLITQAEADQLSDIETYELLFHAGFSTRDQADDFAGRGVGMDVVRTSLAEIRGVITINSEKGKGTSFTIRLPLTLSISKALSCVSNQARVAFPMDGVEDMLDVPRDRIIQNEEGRDCVKWRDRILPFQAVTDLLKFNRTLGRGRVYGGSQDDDVLSIIVLRSANTFVAIQVDQVIGEEEIVIKQLEGPVPKPLGIAGATILGDGRVMPIADVIELIDIAVGRVRREPSSLLWADTAQAEEEEITAKADPTVLIVDDSITVRELLSMSFNKVGYRVEQARDGQEAWDKLRSGLPCDLVFCDIEMPRMDGLELLSRMQKDNHLKSVPIAMLTSRGADRHRQMAVDLGASGYFTKPYLEEALLDAAQRMLNGETLAKGRGG